MWLRVMAMRYIFLQHFFLRIKNPPPNEHLLQLMGAWGGAAYFPE